MTALSEAMEFFCEIGHWMRSDKELTFQMARSLKQASLSH